MPHFSDIPPEITVPDKYLTFEEAFHKLGKHHYPEDWNEYLVLAHENKMRTEVARSPNDAVTIEEVGHLWRTGESLPDDATKAAYQRYAESVRQNAKEDNEQVERYRFVIGQLKSEIHKRLEINGIAKTGEVVKIKQEAWNGELAEEALSKGAVSEENGFFVRYQVHPRHQTGASYAPPPVRRWLIIRKAHLNKILKGEKPGVTPNRKSQLESFEN